MHWDGDGTAGGQERASGWAQAGAHVIPVHAGRISVSVEGCDPGNAGNLWQDVCRQGLTKPAFVDAGAIDVVHRWPLKLCIAEQSAAPTDSDAIHLIRKKYEALGGLKGMLGCVLSPEHDLPDGGGGYNDFENGQIVFSQAQHMTVAAWTAINGIHVDWTVEGAFSYDFYRVNWTGDGGSGVESHATGGPQSGAYLLPLYSGRISVTVEGCVFGKGADLGKEFCSQGPTEPVAVDADTELPAATKVQSDTEFNDRLTSVFQRACTRRLSASDTLDSEFAATALGKMYMAGLPDDVFAHIPICMGEAGDSKTARASLLTEVGNALAGVQISSEVGTSISAAEGAALGAAEGAAAGTAIVPGVGTAVGAAVGVAAGASDCSRKGDYDMALSTLIPIAYLYGNALSTTSALGYYRLIHELLNQTGGQFRLFSDACGVHAPETENHILMTESARYLTNQLRYREIADSCATQDGSQEIQCTLLSNGNNGLTVWLREHLRGFTKNDFHEYNARPYARLTLIALHNLYEYADDPDIATLAGMLIDYLGAKIAISNSGLRRSAPFRRHYNILPYGALYGNNSDEMTWWLITMTGDTDLLTRLRYGRADWGAGDDLTVAALGRYRLPEIVVDLSLKKTPLQILSRPRLSFFQVYRHEAIEIYDKHPEFLISAGGAWAANTPQDKIADLLGQPDTNGAGLPTTLMPAWEGTDRNQFIRIEGSTEPKQRSNTCVAPGFACGVNVVIADDILGRFRPLPRPCGFPVVGLIQQKWVSKGAETGVLGCPIGPEVDATGGQGRVQSFERGQIVFSPPQKLVLAAFQKTDSGDVAIEWNITDQYQYDFFNLRWDKNGANIGQQAIKSDDPNGSRTDGNWTVPYSGAGGYRVVVEGCDGNVLASSICNQGFSSPLSLTLPLAASCVSASGFWVFVDATNGCNAAPLGQGFYVAAYIAPCDSSACSQAATNSGSGGNFGFFEAVAEATVAAAGPLPSNKSRFDLFKERVLANNPRPFKFEAGDIGNIYVRFTGMRVGFKPQHGMFEWGITTGLYNVPKDTEQWRLAKGDVVDADGTGCVVIRNANLGRSLVLNARGPIIPPYEIASADPRAVSCSNLPPPP